MKTFTEEEIAYALRLRSEGWTYEQIQEISGVGRSTVIKYARNHGHDRRKSGPASMFPEETKALACRLFFEEKAMPAISAQTGASRDMVRRWALAAGLPPRPVSWRPRCASC